MEDITRQLAEFSCGPIEGAGALAMMRLSLADWAGCGIAGRNEPVARAVREMVLADGGRGEAAVIGASGRVPARGAALANGTSGHALDYDDTHFGHIGHVSATAVPAALAIAARTGAGGAEFLQACLTGVEVSIRVGMWLGRSHYQTGFHQTATAGTFGAAAAAGRLLGLSSDRMAHVLGLASTRAAGLKSQFGTMGKPCNAGFAAAAGVEVALLAAAGVDSDPAGIESAQGFGPTHAGEAFPGVLEDLGRAYRFETVQHKFHACCHGTHAALEALGALAGQIGAAAVDSVAIAVHPRWMSVCDIARPRTGLEAKFSYRLTAAMVLSGFDTGVRAAFSDAACVDKGLVALRDRVDVAADENLTETAARVEVRAGARTLRAAHDLEAPMSLSERQARIAAKLRSLIGAEAAEAVTRVCQAGGGVDPEAFSGCLAGARS